jgi:hypothetical protein
MTSKFLVRWRLKGNFYHPEREVTKTVIVKNSAAINVCTSCFITIHALLKNWRLSGSLVCCSHSAILADSQIVVKSGKYAEKFNSQLYKFWSKTVNLLIKNFYSAAFIFYIPLTYHWIFSLNLIG